MFIAIAFGSVLKFDMEVNRDRDRFPIAISLLDRDPERDRYEHSFLKYPFRLLIK